MRRSWPWIVLVLGAVSAALYPYYYPKTTFDQAAYGLEVQKEGVCKMPSGEVKCVLATKTVYVLYEGFSAVAIVEDGENGPKYLWKK